MSDYVDCPFCKQKDFDLPGLKEHYNAGYCEVFEAVKQPPTLFERLEENRKLRESSEGTI